MINQQEVKDIMTPENPFVKLNTIVFVIDTIIEEFFYDKSNESKVQSLIEKIEHPDGSFEKNKAISNIIVRETFDLIKHLKDEYLKMAQPFSKKRIFTLEEAIGIEMKYSSLINTEGTAVWDKLTEEDRGEWADAITVLTNVYYESADNAVMVSELIADLNKN